MPQESEGELCSSTASLRIWHFCVTSPASTQVQKETQRRLDIVLYLVKNDRAVDVGRLRLVSEGDEAPTQPRHRQRGLGPSDYNDLRLDPTPPLVFLYNNIFTTKHPSVSVH